MGTLYNLPLVQTNLDPEKISNAERFEMALRDKWRQMATTVNTKSRSITSIYLRVVPAVLPQEIFRTIVGVTTTLKVIQLSAVAITPGAGGGTGLTLRLISALPAGGGATLDVNILPANAAYTDLGQGTLNDFEAQAGNTFTVTAQADDHGGATKPADVMIALDVRYL